MKEKVLSLSIATAMVGCSVLPAVAETTATLKESDSKESAVRDTIEIKSKSYYTHKKLIGKDRYETGVKIAEDLGKTDKLIIVNAVDNISDGLSASSLAGKLDASIIPINPNKIDKTTLELINNAKEIYLIGMYNAIPKKFEDSLTNEKVVRIGGKDRFETSEKIAEYIGDYDNAYIVNGFTGHADAMTMSTVSARDVDPIILTRPNKIPEKVEGVDYTVIGGTDAISNSIQSSLEADRIGGSDRYETNKMVLNKFYSGKDVISFCNGETLVDALSGANYAKNHGIALINRTKNHDLLEYRDTTQLGGLPYDIKFVNIGDTGGTTPVNHAPTEPEIEAKVTDEYNKDGKCKVDISITKYSTDPDGDKITYEWEGKSEDDLYSVGKHKVTVRAVDEHGLKSKDVEIEFTVPEEKRSILLTGVKFNKELQKLNNIGSCEKLEFRTSLPENIESISDKINLAENETEPAYAYVDGDTVVIASDKKIYANEDSFQMFAWLSSLKSIDLSNLDTSKVTTMSYMFAGCSLLTSLDLRSLDTSNVTNMNSMFLGCSSLTSLDLRSLDASNVTYMGGMFQGCSSLTSLDLTSLDTSKVTSMYFMFFGCQNLTSSITISNPNISSYTNMFENCSTASGSKFTVNYSPGCKGIAEKMILTKESDKSNVVLGGEISQQQTNIN